MNLFRKLWQDDAGFVLSAEAALLGTMGIVGATVGLGALSKTVNDELTEAAYAFRSLDQSYVLEGQAGCGAYTASSFFIQQDVETSHAELDEWIEERREIDVERDHDHAPKTTPGPDDDRRHEFEKRRKHHEEEMRKRREQTEKREEMKSDDESKKTDPPKKRRKKNKNDQNDNA